MRRPLYYSFTILRNGGSMTVAMRIIPAIMAVLCLIAFLPWTLGIPGVENDYARGWTIGYYAIIWYLFAYLVVGILGLLARYGKLALPRRWLDFAGMALVAAFVIAQIVAWPLILSSS